MKTEIINEALNHGVIKTIYTIAGQPHVSYAGVARFVMNNEDHLVVGNPSISRGCGVIEPGYCSVISKPLVTPVAVQAVNDLYSGKTTGLIDITAQDLQREIAELAAYTFPSWLDCTEKTAPYQMYTAVTPRKEVNQARRYAQSRATVARSC